MFIRSVGMKRVFRVRRPLKSLGRSYSSVPPSGPSPGPQKSQGTAKPASTTSKDNVSRLLIATVGVAVGIAGAYVYKNYLTASDDKSTLPLSSLPRKFPEYASPSEEQQAISKIKDIVGVERVSTSELDLEHHADSSWQTRHRKDKEIAITVVYPESTEEVSQILKVCHQYRVPVTAYSGGTSLEGHFTPVYGGISIDFGHMNRILKINKGDMDVVVQPAVSWEVLNEELAKDGLMFGPDPGPGAHIGGMVATSCSGTNAYRYGTMRQNIVNLTVVLADGTVIKTRRRPKKSSAGYSLNDTFVGAEGTLGLVTEATLRAVPKPKFRRVGLLRFSNIKDASDTVQSIIQSGLQLDAIELLDDSQMKLLNESGYTDKKYAEDFTLLLRFAGSTESSVKEQIAQVGPLAKRFHSLGFQFARNESETDELWAARKNALWSIVNAAPKDFRVWTTDVAVPISHLSQIITETKSDLDSANLTSGILGHVGDGNFHALICYDPKTQVKQAEAIVHRMTLRAIELDGTVTGEHGIGAGKRHYLQEELGETSIDTMRKIKQALDPRFILNPGKIFSISVSKDVSDH